ncbi:hypothetical protein [Burkholderia ubonensis]|uniref:hypothetical protein n=1 Tax=Burkholderia ubonensis TaxID=101571 RepID=UPI0011606099|nr:hypothetical protein [Burkholderia ubonensis]
MDPRGIYPHGVRYVPTGFFYADEHIAFSLVYGGDWEDIIEDAPYSEFNWASPEELRLMASLVLCELRDEPYIKLYPVVRYSPRINALDLDLTCSLTVHRVRELILNTIKEVHSPFGPHARLLGLQNRKYDVIPPERYGFDRLLRFWNALSGSSLVFFRGIYTIIKADMLGQHYEFSEEAILSLYIALDASFSLVKRHLVSLGAKEPTAHDAAVWLHHHFDSPFGLEAPSATEKYFESFYEERVMTMHPASRYGDMPYAPIMHDDIPHLRRSLREIFAYLLLGEHGEDFHRDVGEHLARYPDREWS